MPQTDTANPVLAEVWRGGIVESRHRGAVCVVGPDGDVLFASGDASRPVFPRSAIKIFQALPLVESGAADAFRFDNRALAMACASHNGEPRHTETAAAMLRACDRDLTALECGTQRPIMGAKANWELAASGGEPSPLHNNCSGKHAGMIATAVHLGENPAGYVTAAHSVQMRIRDVLSAMTDTTLIDAPCGTDGCSVPTWAIPLDATARAMSRLATGAGPGDAHKSAASRLLAACLAEPEMTSGDGRRCAQIIRAAGQKAYVKTGAEGVYCGVLPAAGIGIALKIDDGGTRAAEVAIATVVSALLPDVADALATCRDVTMKNWRRIEVGAVRPSAEFLSALDKL